MCLIILVILYPLIVDVTYIVTCYTGWMCLIILDSNISLIVEL